MEIKQLSPKIYDDNIRRTKVSKYIGNYRISCIYSTLSQLISLRLIFIFCFSSELLSRCWNPVDPFYHYPLTLFLILFVFLFCSFISNKFFCIVFVHPNRTPTMQNLIYCYSPCTRFMNQTSKKVDKMQFLLASGSYYEYHCYFAWFSAFEKLRHHMSTEGKNIRRSDWSWGPLDIVLPPKYRRQFFCIFNFKTNHRVIFIGLESSGQVNYYCIMCCQYM